MLNSEMINYDFASNLRSLLVNFLLSSLGNLVLPNDIQTLLYQWKSKKDFLGTKKVLFYSP